MENTLSALLTAIHREDLPEIKQYLAPAALKLQDPHVRLTQTGETALTMAVSTHSQEIVQFLLDENSDPNIPNHRG